MIYNKKIFIILFAFITFFEIKAQTIEEILKPKLPLDKFNLMASFVSNYKNDGKALAKGAEFVKKNGNKVDWLYYDYSVKRIQHLDNTKLSTSQQVEFLDSNITIAQKQENHFFLSTLYETSS